MDMMTAQLSKIQDITNLHSEEPKITCICKISHSTKSIIRSIKKSNKSMIW